MLAGFLTQTAGLSLSTMPLALIRALVPLLLLLLTGCGSEWNWNQKLIVTVETPSGPARGEAVVRVNITTTPDAITPPEARGMHSAYTGEAAMVALGEGRYLFALLGAEVQRTIETFGDAPPGFGVKAGKAAVGEWNDTIVAMRERRPLPRRAWPRFVTFADIADPASVQLVDPDDLAATFGPGHRIAAVELELTGEAPTDGAVEKVLGWIGSLKGRLKPTNKKFADELTFEETLYADRFVQRAIK